MAWTAYDIVPIDYGWEFLPTIEDVAQKFAKYDAALAVAEEKFEQPLLPRFFELFSQAKEMAHEVGWEGDHQGYAGPRVFFLPAEGDFNYGFVWKQNNNGTTFVISPEPLTWLNKLR